MTKDCDTQYKISRHSAGLTQEQAAEMLAEEVGRPLAVRTLSNYENGHDRVPDDVVAAMAKVYGCPIIVWLHVANNPHIGGFFPEIQKPQTYGDMTLLYWNAVDLLEKVKPAIMRLHGEVDSEKLRLAFETVEQARGMLVSSILYSKGITDGQRQN